MPLPEVVNPICSQKHLQWQKYLNLCKECIVIFCCITIKTLPLTSNLYLILHYITLYYIILFILSKLPESLHPLLHLHCIPIRLNNSILFGLSLQVMILWSMFSHISIYSSHAFIIFCSPNKELMKTCVWCILDNNEFFLTHMLKESDKLYECCKKKRLVYFQREANE